MSSRPLPKSLLAFLTKHPDKFHEGWSEQDGSNERDPYHGWAHWVYLKRGWHNGDEGSHIIHEDTVSGVRAAWGRIGPCGCQSCKNDPED